MTAYVPHTEDLEWTRRAIRGRKVWAVPSGGFVLILNHEEMHFTTMMKMSPSPQEIELFGKVCTNLITIGYSQEKSSFIEGADSIEDILSGMGLTDEEMAHIRLESHDEQNMDEDWVPSSTSIEWTRDHISNLGEGALWVIPDASAILKISHAEKNYTLIVGKNQAANETIYMDKATKIMTILGYELATLFVDDADISVSERLEHIKHWAID